MYPLWKKAGFDDDVMRKNQATAAEVNQTNIGTGSEAATRSTFPRDGAWWDAYLWSFPSV